MALPVLTQLPYMGVHAPPKHRHKEAPLTIEFVGAYNPEAIVDSAEDPSAIFDRKVAHLAELLDCSEAEATRLILRHI